MKSWIREIKDNTEEDIVLMLVGNKIDLVSQRTVTFEEAFELSTELNVPYFETSIFMDKIPSHGKSIEEIFYELVKELTLKHHSFKRILSEKEL